MRVIGNCSVVELNVELQTFAFLLMIPENCEALQLLITWIQMLESYEVVTNRPVVGVDNKIKAFARHQMQCAYRSWFDVTDFSRDYCEIVIFDLHEEWTNVDAGIDDSETVLFAFVDVKNCNWRKL